MTDSEEHRFEVMLGNLLRAGVITAACVVVSGAVLYLFRHGWDTVAYSAFRSEPSDLRTVSGVWREAVSFRPRGLIQFGLLLLVATPVARVAFSAYAFGRLRDYRYVVLTLVVLTLLLFGIFGTH